MLVEDVMTSAPVTIGASTLIKVALQSLAVQRVTALPVVDHEGHVLGVLSEADVIRDSVGRDPRSQARPLHLEPINRPLTVADVCSRPPLTVRPHDDVALVVDLMAATGVKSVPVVDDHERIIGVLSRSDIVRGLARADEAIAGEVHDLFDVVGHADWLVEVVDGVVEISGPAGAGDISLARAAANTVTGVIEVRVL